MTSEPELINTPAGPALLKRSRRKTLAISVLPNGALELSAPQQAAIETILPIVDKRLAWIRAQRRDFEKMNAARPLPRYVNGATHRYLGRQYRLKIAKGKPPHVVLRGGYFHVTTPNIDERSIQEALDQWYRRQALQQFERRLGAWNEWCRRHDLPEPRLRLRQMRKRWGSAKKDGSITLNPDLVQAPSACIDYVIIHEICHLKHPNHGAKFRALLARLCPDWQRLKERLESPW